MQPPAPETADPSPDGSRLVLLGTAGGPRVKVERSAPAQAVVVDGHAYLVDCGYGVLRQLMAARISSVDLAHVFITHHHSDHNLDLAALLLLSWAGGRTRKLTVWGPPPLKRMVGAILQAHDYDITIRTGDEGRLPLADLVAVVEIDRPGLVMSDDHARVSCAFVHHPPVEPALAFRIDTRDRSVVISGDTTPCDALVKLAGGADVLVHETMFAPAIEATVRQVRNATRMGDHLRASHTTTEEVGVVARRADVGTLVLSHLVPSAPGLVSPDQWLEQPTAAFGGPVVLGHDLLTI